MSKHVQGEKIHLTVKISRNNNKLQVKGQRAQIAMKRHLEAMGGAFKGDGRGVWE